jgi:hypothetical protein
MLTVSSTSSEAPRSKIKRISMMKQQMRYLIGMRKLDEKMETDYEIGRNFTDELIPYSLEYYLGINPENDDEFDDVDEEEDDDKDKDEDDDSEDDKKKKKVTDRLYLIE